MILQRCFSKLKSAAVADSWFMHSPAMQRLIKTGLNFFNRFAPRTRLCQRVKKGSLGKHPDIHPTAVIDYDRVIIGDFCTIGRMAVIEKNTIIGNNVTIGEYAVIGSEGFEVRRFKGEVIPVAHLGGVIIHDNVVVGPHTCIDKSSLGEYTEIGESSRLSGSVEVGHGITLGKQVTVEEGTMIGGYSKIGDRARIGRRCSITDGLTLEDGVVLPDNAVVTRDVKRSPQERDRSPS